VADQGQCLKNAQEMVPGIQLCKTWVCEDSAQSERITKFCHCRPPFPPPPKGMPCPYGANSPVVVSDGPGTYCACCCSCFANGTLIAETLRSARPIESFAIGDSVLAAGPALAWEQVDVEFSSGVQPSEEAGKEVIHVLFRLQDSEHSIVVTPDHVFYVHARSGDGFQLLRAVRLIPGVDRLVTPEGEEAPVLAIELGGWFKGLHHIATTNTPAVDLERHLLISDGIVSGDWALQISDLDQPAFDAFPTSSSDPVLGSAEYEEAHDFATRFAASLPDVELDDVRPEGFRPYGHDALEVPADAQTFISRRQAEEVLSKGVQRAVSDSTGRDGAYYLFRLINGFYPDMHFDLAWDELLPNAYSFRKYGLDIVVLSGGLVRTKGMSIDGLALVLAHEVGHLIGGPPQDRSGRYSCQGQADLTAIGAVLRGVYWMGDYPMKVERGLSQVTRFFDLIESRTPKRPDLCNEISLDCRLDAFQAGLMLAELPACAGGPPAPYLTVVGSRERATPGDVVLTFSLPVSADSVARGDFTFDPPAEVEGAVVDAKNEHVVVVSAELDPEVAYRLTIEDVLSTSGAILEDGRAIVELEALGAGDDAS
jgi:hypothetical protein